jgi:hypothetical protein
MFARSFGIYAKSDKNDAKVIARFAAERKPKAMQPVSAQQVALKEETISCLSRSGFTHINLSKAAYAL